MKVRKAAVFQGGGKQHTSLCVIRLQINGNSGNENLPVHQLWITATGLVTAPMNCFYSCSFVLYTAAQRLSWLGAFFGSGQFPIFHQWKAMRKLGIFFKKHFFDFFQAGFQLINLLLFILQLLLLFFHRLHQHRCHTGIIYGFVTLRIGLHHFGKKLLHFLR